MIFYLKYRHIKFGLLLLLGCSYGSAAISQSNHITYSFINYSVHNGLPSSEVHDLYQDPLTGLLWIATDRGLVKYDGYNFTTYTMDNGLTDNVILRLTPDKYGNLWCHTFNNQLCYLDNTGNIKAFKYTSILRLI